MKNNLFKYGIVFILGVLSFFITKKYFFSDEKNIKSDYDYRIIAHEIKKLNKMIVLEQNYSEFVTHKNSILGDNSIGNFFNFDDKKIVLHISARTQAVYDMKKLKIEIDSINKIITIKNIPEVEIETFPNVEIFSLDQGMLNNYSEKELQIITENAKKNIQHKAEMSNLKTDAEKQFLENINDLWFLAKTYNWKIINETNKQLKIKF